MTGDATANGGKSVFISYAAQDRPTAQLLALRLQDAGLAVWLDADLRPGDQWQDVVDRKLRVSCPLLSGPSTIAVWTKEGTTNACEEAQARGDYREAT